VKWPSLKDKYDDVYFYSTKDGEYQVTNDSNLQSDEPPSKTSQLYPMWIWIKSKPFFRKSEKCGDITQDIWNIIRWCAFPGIFSALQQREEFKKPIADPKKYDVVSIFLVDLLDSFFDCVLSEEQETISLIPFSINQNRRDILDVILQTHANDAVLTISSTRRFHIGVTSNDSLNSLNLLHKDNIRNVYRSCNSYNIDNTLYQNLLTNFVEEWPLTSLLERCDFNDSKNSFSGKILDSFQSREEIKMPISAPWKTPNLNFQVKVFDEYQTNMFLNEQFQSLSTYRDKLDVSKYLISRCYIETKQTIVFARNDLRAMVCSTLEEHDLDPLTIEHYRNIVKTHLDIFKAMPMIFGGPVLTDNFGAQFALGNQDPQRLLETFNSTQLFVHFLAFQITFFLWKINLGPITDVASQMANDICSILKVTHLVTNLLEKFVRSATIFADFYVASRYYIFQTLDFFKMSYPNEEILTAINKYFTSRNSLDAIIMIQGCPLFNQIRSSINFDGNNLTWNIISRVDALRNDFKTQFDFDNFDARLFDIVFNYVMQSISSGGSSSLEDIFKQYLFVTNFNYVDYVQRLKLENPLEQLYLEKAEFKSVCGMLTPSVTRFQIISKYGELGCTTDENWMKKPMDISNTWLLHLVTNIQENVMKNGFWYCGNNDSVNQTRATHILRWLGYRYMQAASEAYDEVQSSEKNSRWKKLDKETQNVIMMIWFLNRSPSAFPFIEDDDAARMIDYTGNNNAGMCRLSNSRPLEIVIQRETNQSPMFIPFEVWNKAMNDAVSNMESPKIGKRKIYYLARVQYALRSLAAESDVYLVRNLEFIRQMAIKCNQNLFLTDTTWGVSEAFGFKSIYEELQFVTDKLKDSKKWKTLIQPTAEASDNIGEVNNVLSTNCVAPRAVDYGRGTRSGRVASNDTFIPSHTGAKFLFGEFSGNNECIDEKLPENRYWMMTKQPFMALDEMQNLLTQYKSSDYPTSYLQLVIKVWPILDEIIGEKWCHNNDQYQGNRNKTLLVNWLGPKTLHFLLGNNWREKPTDKLSLNDWQTIYGLEWMMRCDFFYGFLNPYEQEVYAYTHLKQAVISLDFTKPHAYNCFVAKNSFSDSSTTHIQHEIANNATKHKNFTASDVFGKLTDATILPFPVLVLQYIMTKFTDPMIDQKPMIDNAASCGYSYTERGFYLNMKVHINDAVPSELAIQLIDVLVEHKLLNSKKIMDFKWLQDFTSKKEEAKSYITLKELKNQVNKMAVEDTFRLYSTGSLPSFNPFNVERHPRKDLTTIQEFLSNQDFASLGTTIVDEKLLEKYNDWKSSNNSNSKAQFEYALSQVAEEIKAKRPGFQVAEGQPRKVQEEERKTKLAHEHKSIDDFFRENVYPKMKQVGFVDANQLKFILQGLLDNNIIPAMNQLFKRQQSLPLNNRSMSICEALLNKSNDMEVLAFPPIGFSDNLNALKSTKYQQLHVGWEFKEKSLRRSVQKFKNLFRNRKMEVPGQISKQQQVQQVLIPQQPVIPQGPLRTAKPAQVEYFSKTQDEWSLESDALQAQVEKNLESSGQCGDRLYPAFELQAGLLLPRCGKENWISQAEVPSEQQLAELKDRYAKELLIFIQDTTRATWCIQTYQKVRLWRWIGMKCFSGKSLNRLKREALIKQSQDTSNYLLEFANVSDDNKSRLLEELRTPEDIKETICERRIQFLAQTINTNLIFPFVVDEQEARLLSGKYTDKVVVMLDWSKSGRIVCYLTPSDGSPVQLRYLQAEEIVSEHLFATTSLRLKVFELFSGGIIADNELYHASRCQMLGTTAKNLRFLSIRDMLPRFYQEQFDNLVRQPVTPETRVKAKQLKDMSIVAQSKNLTTSQIDLLKQIIALEDAASKSQNFLPTAQLLYSQQLASNTAEDVRQFQVLSLCSRPEFIGYLRDKYHQLNPTISIGEIERLPRSYLCQALLGATNVRSIIMPIKVWDIRNVPSNLQDSFGFIDLFRSDPNFQIQMESFLVKNYGVTLQEMREYNKDIPKETLEKYAALVKTTQQQTITTASDIRVALRNKCGNITKESDCSKIKVNSSQLCRWSEPFCQAANTSALNFLDFVIAAFCQPNLGLESNEVGFIDLVFRTLSNFFVFINQRKPTTDSLDSKCNLNGAMMTEFKRLAAIQAQTWQTFSVEDILRDQKAQELNVRFKLFQGGSPIPKSDLRQIWAEAAGLNESDAILLTILLLIYCGLITRVFIIP
jgi:hypothetical protein